MNEGRRENKLRKWERKEEGTVKGEIGRERRNEIDKKRIIRVEERGKGR